MSLPKKHKSSMEFPNKLYEDGLYPTKSNSKNLREDIIDSLSGNEYVDVNDSSTAEFIHLNKKITLNNKLNTCEKNIPSTKLLAKSEAALTSKEPSFAHFYNKSSKEMFQKLWFPPATDLFDSDSISLPGFHHNSVVNYRLYQAQNTNLPNKKYLKTCCQLLHSSLPDITEEENIELPKINKGMKKIDVGSITRCRKIRIYPDEDYIEYFNKCFGTTRYLYNKTIATFSKKVNKIKRDFRKSAKRKGCVHIIQTKKKGSKNANIVTKRCCGKLDNKYFCKKHIKCKLKYNIPTNFIYWKKIIVKDENNLPEEEEWLKEIAYDTRQLVIKNVMGGIKSALSNLKAGNIKKFEMKFKTKRDDVCNFYIDHRALNKKLILFPRKFKKPLKINKRDLKWLRNHIETEKMSDMVISREKPGIYFLQIPYDTKLLKNDTKNEIVSVDPGIITHGTFYDPSGKCGKMGDGLGLKISQIYLKIDSLNSQISKEVNYLEELKEEHNKNKKIKAISIENNLRIKSNEKILLKQKNKCTKDISSVIKCLEEKLSEYTDSRIGKENNKINISRKRIKRLKKRIRLLRRKKQNVTKECHQKIIKYYCDNYRYIVIPILNTRQIAKKQKRQGMSKEARKTMGICHGKFMERLKTKVESIEDCTMIIVKEDYTSKTCGRCGSLNEKLGRKRKFNCPYCGLSQDRDTNAARNILIRGLIKTL